MQQLDSILPRTPYTLFLRGPGDPHSRPEEVSRFSYRSISERIAEIASVQNPRDIFFRDLDGAVRGDFRLSVKPGEIKDGLDNKYSTTVFRAKCHGFPVAEAILYGDRTKEVKVFERLFVPQETVRLNGFVERSNGDSDVVIVESTFILPRAHQGRFYIYHQENGGSGSSDLRCDDACTQIFITEEEDKMAKAFQMKV